MRKYTKIFVGVLVLALFLLFLRSVTGMASGSYADEVASAVESDRRRFRPENSLDISMAMGLVTHDPPQMLSPPTQGPPLLLYPPSAETLARLSGKNQTKTVLLTVLVGMAFLVTGLGGLQDMLGVRLPMSKEHGWNDGMFLMLVAIFVQITMK